MEHKRHEVQITTTQQTRSGCCVGVSCFDESTLKRSPLVKLTRFSETIKILNSEGPNFPDSTMSPGYYSSFNCRYT